MYQNARIMPFPPPPTGAAPVGVVERADHLAREKKIKMPQLFYPIIINSSTPTYSTVYTQQIAYKNDLNAYNLHYIACHRTVIPILFQYQN